MIVFHFVVVVAGIFDTLAYFYSFAIFVNKMCAFWKWKHTMCLFVYYATYNMWYHTKCPYSICRGLFLAYPDRVDFRHNTPFECLKFEAAKMWDVFAFHHIVVSLSEKTESERRWLRWRRQYQQRHSHQTIERKQCWKHDMKAHYLLRHSFGYTERGSARNYYDYIYGMGCNLIPTRSSRSKNYYWNMESNKKNSTRHINV